MQACLHVSGEGVSSQNLFFKIPFCVRRFKSIELSKWELCEETPSPDRSADALRSTSPTRGEVKEPCRKAYVRLPCHEGGR